MKRITWVAGVLVLVGFAGNALAGSKADVRKQMEMTMLVTGSIDIETDGRVGEYRLDQAEKLPQGVRNLVDRAIPQWRFAPVEIDGQAVKARSRMGVRVVAKQLGDGNYQLRVNGASFGESEQKAMKDRVAGTGIELSPPRYPMQAVNRNVTGTVYLLVKVDRNGDVLDAFAEQVNLTVLGNEREMDRARKLLATPSIEHAKRKWKFMPGTQDDPRYPGYWIVRVPVEYKFADAKAASYGEWQAYIPGPRQRPGWASEADALQSPDAMIAGQTYAVGQGPKLLTPLTEG